MAEKGGRLASGEDEAVEILKLAGPADKPGIGTQGGEGFGVSLVRTLQGEDADDWFAVFGDDTPPPLLCCLKSS